MHENEVSELVIGRAIEVHRQLGPGLLESVYEEVLCHELSEASLHFERQQSVPIKYKGVLLGTPLRLDLIVEEKIIVEIKAMIDVSLVDRQDVPIPLVAAPAPPAQRDQIDPVTVLQPPIESVEWIAPQRIDRFLQPISLGANLDAHERLGVDFAPATRREQKIE